MFGHSVISMKTLDKCAIVTVVLGFVAQRVISKRVPYSYRQTVTDLVGYLTNTWN